MDDEAISVHSGKLQLNLPSDYAKFLHKNPFDKNP